MRYIVVAGLAGAVLVMSAAPGEAAGAGPITRYARVHGVCAAPAPGRASCLALALVPVRPSVTGARPYLSGGGATSTGPAGGLTPADLAGAYAYSPLGGGAGQTVGIVDAFDDPNIEADLATFDSHYGLPECSTANGCLEKVGQTGSPSALPQPDSSGWSVEITLDMETVHSVCPSCKILLVEADSESFADLAAAVNEAVNLGAGEVSNSYGGPEAGVGATEALAYDHPEVVMAAASGDSGYLSWDRLFEGASAPEAADAPASLPSVVSVGGTSLKLNASGTRKSESVWNDNGLPSGKGFKQPSATGSGCSTLYTAPSWQQEAPGYAAAACAGKRLDNDVAAVADPFTGFDVYDSFRYQPSFTPGWLTVGGTSLTSPLISALFALAGGSHGAAYPAATLYSHLGQTAALFDVASGGSGFCDGEAPGPCGEPEVNELLGRVDCEGTTACDAAPGFDGPSGVGAPVGLLAFGGSTEAKPTVITGAASSVEATAAVLNATVNPNGATVTACTFEYGPSTAYGQSAPCSSLPGSGMSPVAVSAPISGLTSKAVYRFRITATSAGGTSYGKAKKLKTR